MSGEIVAIRAASASRGPRAGLVLALTALALYAALWLVMWMPVILAGNEGWLFLFPIFLLVWGSIEALAIVSAVISLVDAVRRRGSRASRSWSIGLSLGLSFLSLPALWFVPDTWAG